MKNRFGADTMGFKNFLLFNSIQHHTAQFYRGKPLFYAAWTRSKLSYEHHTRQEVSFFKNGEDDERVQNSYRARNRGMLTIMRTT